MKCVSKGTSQQNHAGHSWSRLPSWFLLFNRHLLSVGKNLSSERAVQLFGLCKNVLLFLSWIDQTLKIKGFFCWVFFKFIYFSNSLWTNHWSGVGSYLQQVRSVPDQPLNPAVQIRLSWQPVFRGILGGQYWDQCHLTSCLTSWRTQQSALSAECGLHWAWVSGGLQ